MEIREANGIVSALANGVDPITGEVLADESPYNDPNVIRALFTVLKSSGGLKPAKKTLEQRQKENVAVGRPRNAGLPWTEELKEELAERFENGASPGELARHFERTRGAILSELEKQGLIEQPTADSIP